jgi:hypothetical protein
MRLDKLREKEVAKRRGSTGRTIFQVIWLLISIGLAYAFSEYVLFGGGYISENLLYNQLFIPRSVPPWALRVGVIFIIVVVMQFFVFLGFALGDPRGRRRTGRASGYSDDPDPFDDHHG